MSNVDHSNTLIHYGVKGMRWGVRKDRKPKNSSSKKRGKSKPLSTREKVMVGSLITGGVLLAAGGATIAALKVRNTQYKISTARGYAWVENMLSGDMRNYQTTTAEQLRATFPNKNTFNVAKQYLQNKDMLKYING